MAGWRYTIDLKDVLHNKKLSFAERRDVTVKRVRESQWAVDTGAEDGLAELFGILDDLAEAPDGEAFYGRWDDIYVIADRDRAWIETE